jgi:hypothetical protein
MGWMNPLKNATIQYAEQTGGDHGDPEIGALNDLAVRLRRGVTVVDENGVTHENTNRVSCDDYEFSSTNRIWLPEDDPSVLTKGRKILMIGSDTTAGRSSYYAVVG